jgi:hypothetical protein
MLRTRARSRLEDTSQKSSESSQSNSSFYSRQRHSGGEAEVHVLVGRRAEARSSASNTRIVSVTRLILFVIVCISPTTSILAAAGI